MALKSATITVMQRAAEKAGRKLARDFGEVEHLQVSKKGPADFVSAADTRAEQVIREELSKARPEFGFLLEENGEIEGRNKHCRWIVDPLDGTTNFLHGIPHFCISIALEQNGEITAALIYEPLSDNLFWAEKGHGAYLNNRRLRVSARRKLPESLLATGIPFLGRPNHAFFLNSLETIMPEVSGIRRFGSAALDLAYVAAGRFDGFWETDLKPWDIAAGILLVREAGGQVTTFDGKADVLDTGQIMATNGKLHGPLTRLLATALKKTRAENA
ncbi:inositol monophosphatase family protein [Luteithermobacter gelatinilyticus]|uniref:inositol monophosphatase family protein n=1 Tax=Luteithermobacter gelatinilyticus TaxID=2582913 RepID=UPI00110612CC|nr:inositol monophosphatase family protein [Luteithermobacter gelatinilyticus]|tara:strand:- start:9439 stop:10257 length:819 start_codon:yes stop_codon:yes gene_type:complete